MFMPELNLGLSEYAVSRAIPELHREHDYISRHDIAARIGCSSRTVERAIANLIEAGVIERCERSKGGYRYYVKS